jgi:hypothetical protein
MKIEKAVTSCGSGSHYYTNNKTTKYFAYFWHGLP